MRRMLLASVALVGCSAADIPEVYHGRAGRTVLALPSAIAASVLYDEESDWAPSDKPKSERTDRDAIRRIEFFVDLDHPDSVISDQAARERIMERSGTLHLPALVGHIIGITVDFPPKKPPSAEEIRSQFKRYHVAPAFRTLEPATPEYGFETRRTNWSRPMKNRVRYGSGIFDIDVDYLNAAENTYIFCNDARQAVAPFAPMPTCQFKIVVPELAGIISGSIDRGDVHRWRELRTAALATLHSFVVRPG